MSLALVGDRKGIRSLKTSALVIPHGMYFPSTPLPSLPFLLLSEKDSGLVLKKIFGRRSRGKPPKFTWKDDR